jgi:hypothetical protein
VSFVFHLLSKKEFPMRLFSLALALLAVVPLDVFANPGIGAVRARAVVRQRVIQPRPIVVRQRVIQQQVYAQPIVQQVYAQPIVQQQVYAQPVVQQYAAPITCQAIGVCPPAAISYGAAAFSQPYAINSGYGVGASFLRQRAFIGSGIGGLAIRTPGFGLGVGGGLGLGVRAPGVRVFVR